MKALWEDEIFIRLEIAWVMPQEGSGSLGLLEWNLGKSSSSGCLENGAIKSYVVHME